MPKMTCDGWWEQEGYGRQPMTDLVIEFTDGRLLGQGDDIVGPFVLKGQLDDDRLYLRKQYIGQHAIDYHGSSMGEGNYAGQWSVNGYVGGEWSIRFLALSEAT